MRRERKSLKNDLALGKCQTSSISLSSESEKNYFLAWFTLSKAICMQTQRTYFPYVASALSGSHINVTNFEYLLKYGNTNRTPITNISALNYCLLDLHWIPFRTDTGPLETEFILGKLLPALLYYFLLEWTHRVGGKSVTWSRQYSRTTG